MGVREMRPRFQLEVALPPPKVIDRVREHLASPDCIVEGTAGNHGFELNVDDEHRHFWSPSLNVEVRPTDQGAVLQARFAPHPNVWTLFLAIYAVLTFAAIGSAMFGISQWTMDSPPTALVGLPVALALIGFVYGAAFIGQGLGGPQMYVLRRNLDEALGTRPGGSAPS